MLFIPGDFTEEPLQPTDAASRDPEGHRLNRLAFQWAQLADHIIKEMGARLTPGKTVVKEALELLQFVCQLGYITGSEIKGGNGQPVAFRPTRREHTLPPDDVYSTQGERIEGLL
jgi:hypothetical protein